MSKQSKQAGKQKSDKKLAAAAEFVRNIGGLEKARRAIEAISNLRKAG